MGIGKMQDNGTLYMNDAFRERMADPETVTILLGRDDDIIECKFAKLSKRSNTISVLAIHSHFKTALLWALNSNEAISAYMEGIFEYNSAEGVAPNITIERQGNGARLLVEFLIEQSGE